VIDDRALAFASRERLAGEFGERYGITLELLDSDLDTECPAEWPAVVARAITDEAMRPAGNGRNATRLADLKAATLANLKSLWGNGLTEFVSRLDPEAVRAARAISALRPSSYNYLCSFSSDRASATTSANGDEQMGRLTHLRAAKSDTSVTERLLRYRSQALAVFPFLEPIIVRSEFASVRAAIDEGKKLVDVLADHYGVSRGAIRSLRGLGTKDLGRWVDQLGTILKLLVFLPSAWWPRDAEGWRKFIGTIDAIVRATRHPINTSANLLWLRQAAENGYDLSRMAPEELVRMGHDIDEFLDTLRQGLHFTLASNAEIRIRPHSRGLVSVIRQFKMEVGLVRLVEIARRYGDAYRRAELRYREEAELLKGVRWQQIGSGNAAYGSMVVTPLLTPDELSVEGQAMRNCVGTYASACASGKSQIWSLRHADLGPMATLETRVINARNGAHHVLISQLKGMGNGPAPAAAQETAKLHIAALSRNPGAIRLYLDWKISVSGRPLSERQRQALMLPILDALTSTLSGKWSFDKLVARCKADQASA
jgi:hypothetical protein